MVSKKLLGQTNVFGAQIFYFHKIIKIVVIYKNEYFILAMF